MIANSKLKEINKKVIEIETLIFKKEIKFTDPEIKDIKNLEFEYTK